MAYIVVTQVGREPCRHELTRKIVIGRSSECDVSVADRALSRRHCAIEPANEAWTHWAVADLDSLNGTRVGMMYVNRRALEDGDEITLGDVLITFHAAGYVGRRPDRPEAPMQSDDACINEAVLKAGPWPQPRMAEARRLSMPEWVDTPEPEDPSDSQTATADETATPERARPYGLIAGIAASAATLGAAAMWVLSH